MGIDLKPALRDINTHFLQLPIEVRERGLMSFADVPPPGNRVSELWDRHMRPDYREPSETEMSPEKEAELVARLKAFRKQETINSNDPESGDEEMISIARKVRRKRGSWWQVPKDMPDPKDDDE